MAGFGWKNGEFAQSSIHFCALRRAGLCLKEIQLIQKEKMASLGQLTAGVAHEMNTPFRAIQSNAGLIGMLLD